MKKVIYSLYVNEYCPEIKALTEPYLQQWADKIGAKVQYITDRKFPDMPPNYEKFQIYELGQDNDWSFFIDVDALIHPDMYDPTEFIDKYAVTFTATDFANIRFKYDYNFNRHGKNFGATTWFVIVSNNTIDAWTPFHLQKDITYEQAKKNIYPILWEKQIKIDQNHLIDDYLVSRNIARFGLNVNTLMDVEKKNCIGGLYFHEYLVSKQEKIELLKKTIFKWQTSMYVNPDLQVNIEKMIPNK